MSRITALLVGIAALTVISTVAEAADGCGRGWYYNGRRCVPQDEPGYYRREYSRDCYAANVILSAVGYNLRLVLAWLRTILRVVLLALFQTFAIRPALKPVF